MTPIENDSDYPDRNSDNFDRLLKHVITAAPIPDIPDNFPLHMEQLVYPLDESTRSETIMMWLMVLSTSILMLWFSDVWIPSFDKVTITVSAVTQSGALPLLLVAGISMLTIYFVDLLISNQRH